MTSARTAMRRATLTVSWAALRTSWRPIPRPCAWLATASRASSDRNRMPRHPPARASTRVCWIHGACGEREVAERALVPVHDTYACGSPAGCFERVVREPAVEFLRPLVKSGGATVSAATRISSLTLAGWRRRASCGAGARSGRRFEALHEPVVSLVADGQRCARMRCVERYRWRHRRLLGRRRGLAKRFGRLLQPVHLRGQLRQPPVHVEHIKLKLGRHRQHGSSS